MNDSTNQPELLQAEGPVLLTLHDGSIAHVRLNRAESANGLNIELLKALHEVLMQVHGDVRVATSYLQLVASLLIRMNPPVVSAVQGFAAGGGGMGLVCSSDFVIAAESSKFLAGATRVAMVPDAGVSVTLTQLVGLRKATEILMLNPVITAPEAKAMGLVTRVVPDASLEDEAWALARQLAQGAPAALANTKRLLWSGIGQGVEAAMPEENSTQAMLCGMSDALEGLTAVIEKRTPRFTGR